MTGQTPMVHANSPRPLGELFDAHRGLVYRWAAAHGARHDAALDIVQEAFARMLVARPDCRSEGAQLAWLRRTASNLAVDTRRGPASRMRSLPGQHDPAAESVAGSVGEHRARLAAAMASLSEAQRLVLIAKTVDGHTFSHIAAELGVAVPTAKTHFARALDSVRRSMGLARPEGVV